MEICPRLALVARVMKIWDATSNREIIVRSMAKGLDGHRVRQNLAYLVERNFYSPKSWEINKCL